MRYIKINAINEIDILNVMRKKKFSFQLLCVLLRDTCVQLLKKMQIGGDWKKEKTSHWRAQRLLCVALALNFHTEFSH